MKIAMLVNDIKTEWAEYSTTHFAMTATRMGHEVWYMGVGDLAYYPDENVHAQARRAAGMKYHGVEGYFKALRGSDAIIERITIDEFDVLWLRNNPAEDVIARPWARLAGINFGRLAMRHNVLVVNDPNGLSRAVTKMYLEIFPKEVRPLTLISRDRNEIRAFINEQNGVAVIKPLSGYGGRNVFLARSEDNPNLNQMIEAVTREGYVLAQEYLPQANKGDTRLMVLNGEPLIVKGRYAALRRIRQQGDSDMRSNITAGAIAAKAEVNQRMLDIAEMVKPVLKEDGMFLVGLDIIGNKLTEINVFSPGGFSSMEKLEAVAFCKAVIQSLEKKVEYRKACVGNITNIELATL